MRTRMDDSVSDLERFLSIGLPGAGRIDHQVRFQGVELLAEIPLSAVPHQSDVNER